MTGVNLRCRPRGKSVVDTHQDCAGVVSNAIAKPPRGLASAEVAEHEAQSRTEVLQHQVHDRIRGTASRALVIAVLDQGRPRVVVSPDVVTRRDWN
jgi:hypothetical protein